jgi:hypothetical protein
MAEQVPTHIRDGDRLSFRMTEATDTRAVYTFVDTLNQGTLFDRPPAVFRNAALQHRLFELQNNSRGDTLLGTIIIQDNAVDKNTRRRESELGGLVVHPGARGQRLASLLTRVSLLHDLIRAKSSGWDCEYQAHLAKGNTGPELALKECGFIPAGNTVVYRGEVDASLEHMLEDGADGVLMKRVVYDKSKTKDLVSWFQHMQHNDFTVRNSDAIQTRLDLSEMLGELDISLLAE